MNVKTDNAQAPEAGISSRPISNQVTDTMLPFVGAQVFIEPGQTEEEIDHWFRVMKEHHMTVCRIRMFESYMRDADYNWDFELFDHAFRAAGKHGVRIWATLYPVTGDNINIGGDKFPDTFEKQESIATYIEETVKHFKEYESLAGWVLINEPGIGGGIPGGEFTGSKFSEWRKDHPAPDKTAKGYPVLMNLEKEYFLLDHTTDFLQWISDEIRKYDPDHDLHVNNHNIFVNCAEYDFPEWRKFLTSFGGSAHASWHFGYFHREKYAVAMSADCEMVHSGSGALPWYMTEIQGGNNTYSGVHPMCPTPEEIAQWIWITLGTEGKGVIFWTLNPRASGIEAGEWGMIDLQGEPSERLIAAGEVAETIRDHSALFSVAKKASSGISILYSREALWAEKQMILRDSRYDARNPGGVMKSTLAWFEALCEMGIGPGLQALDEFDFSREEYTNETIILSHQLSMPSSFADSLERFVSRGGKLIVDGLTAYFDEHLHHTMQTGFAFEPLFGGNVSEFRLVDDLFSMQINDCSLLCHLWKGFVVPTTGQPIMNGEGEQVGLRNRFGEGEVIWIPSLIGLGSRLEDDYSALQALLYKEAGKSINAQPARFSRPHKNMLMKTMRSGNQIITVLMNKNDIPLTVELVMTGEVSKAEAVYPERSEWTGLQPIHLDPEETKVLVWHSEAN